MTELFISVKLGFDKFVIPQKDFSLKTQYSYLLDGEDSIQLYNTDLYLSIYNRLVNNMPPSTSCLFDILCGGFKYFDNWYISGNSLQLISNWIKKIGKHSYAWSELLNKPDYSLELFSKRFWPYHSTEHKEWQEVAAEANQYPHTAPPMNAETENQELLDEYKDEFSASQRYNNFLGHAVIDPSKYNNHDNYIKILKFLNAINLTNLMFELMMRLLITPADCHIVKNIYFMNLLKPLIKDKKYMDIFTHFMYYAMYILNHEDTVMFSQIKRNHRIIYTHDEALTMPNFNTYHIELDPYIQQLTGETYLQTSIPYYIRCNRYIQPIDVFERRFYLATGGALANIPLHKYNASVAGSILIPCLAYSSLEKDFKRVRFNTARSIRRPSGDLYNPVGIEQLTEEDKDFMTYLEYLYPSYHSLVDADYIKSVLSDDTSDAKTNYNLLSDIDIAISIDNYDTFEEIATMLCEHIRLNCLQIGEVRFKKVYTASAFKFKLAGPGLIRPIEIFRVSYGPERMVKKFHCPVVRSWYDGSNPMREDIFKHSDSVDKYWAELFSKGEDIKETKNNYYKGVNIINSGLCTLMSGVNNNYKWFFNSKPCVEVILKYAQRGYSTICNKNEIKALCDYMKITPKWAMFIDKDVDMCGMMSIEHVFLNPCISNGGIRYGLRPFAKTINTIYSKNLYVGMPKSCTDYGMDLNIKYNSKITMPDINKVNMFVEYLSADDTV